MTGKRLELIYDTKFVAQMHFIERKYHTFIRTTIEQQLIFEPNVETRNRKILTRASDFGARWELRFDDNNQFRVFLQRLSRKGGSAHFGNRCQSAGAFVY